MDRRVLIGGHRLPPILVRRVLDGSWPPTTTATLLAEIFGEVPDPSAKLYTLDEMEGETSRWQQETDPAYLGVSDDSLDPTRSILIGDLGFDRPIGIDLREDPAPVRLLTIEGRWRVVADSTDRLLGLLLPREEPSS